MELTYQIAMAAGQDAGDKHARTHGRSVWNEEDFDVAAETFRKLHQMVTVSGYTPEAAAYELRA